MGKRLMILFGLGCPVDQKTGGVNPGLHVGKLKLSKLKLGKPFFTLYMLCYIFFCRR